MADNKDQLKALYPFLHQQDKDPVSENIALLESVKIKAADSVSVKQAFFAANAQALVDASKAIADCYRQGGKLLAMGNGGSSCDASHISVEFQHPVTAGRPALPALNMTNDIAVISAVANDVGIKHIFSRQIDAHAKEHDCVVAFSTSGNSENLIYGLRKAREMGLTCIGFAGGDGGKMKSSGILDHCLVVDTDSIHRVQEVHVTCYHILWDLTHTLLADSRGKTNPENA
ncbi:MAG: SIS domain-containing protein [Gammaproteobacteria bacterium]|nr:SIS domain-containing protein [Gammaproteobacteria bacterium]